MIFDYLTLPVRLIGDGRGWLEEIECRRMELGEPDESGRRRPVEIPGSEFRLRVDASVCAIGNSPNPLISMTTPGLEVGKRGTIEADEETGRHVAGARLGRRRRRHRGGDGDQRHGRRPPRRAGDARDAHGGRWGRAAMRIRDIAAALACEALTAYDESVDIESVVASDGMSEVLAFSSAGCLMLTGLTNVQAVRTAVVADVHAIVFVRGKRPPVPVLDLAREKGIPLLVTSLGMFDSCGILHRAGLKGAM